MKEQARAHLQVYIYNVLLTYNALYFPFIYPK